MEHNTHENNGMLGATRHNVVQKLNHFADLTSTEFSKTHASCFHGNMESQGTPVYTHKYSGAALPESVDWRSTDNPKKMVAITRVKNQGRCGSCWSFSATGALEGHWAINEGDLIEMSEQELIDCSKKDGNMGCNGGLMDNAFNWEEGHDVCTEKSYDYTASEGQCHCSGPNGECTPQECDIAIPNGRITGFVDVDQNDANALMEALTKGPVSIAIEADQSLFQFYKGGILKNNATDPDDPDSDGVCGTQLDHGVLCVGYGTEEFEGKKQGYWIVKNSWGPEWGDDGYIRLHRDLAGEDTDGEGGMCGIMMQASYPVFKGDPDDKSSEVADSPMYENPPCQKGEEAIRLQGLNGQVCAPLCDGGSCPAAPAGTHAKPMCAVQGQGHKFCALICQPHSEDPMCPNGSTCEMVQQGVGVCMYASGSENAIEGTFEADVVRGSEAITE